MADSMNEFFKALMHSITSYPITKLLVSAIGGFFAYFIGAESYTGVTALSILCLLDVLAAFYVLHKKHKSISSHKLPKKALDLLVYLFLIGSVNILGKTSTLFGTVLVDMIIVWFSATEVLSILEHASEVGYKIPITLLKNIRKAKEYEHSI